MGSTSGVSATWAAKSCLRSYFLHDIHVPRLSTRDADDLDTDISVEEIKTTIHKLQSGKATGPNGIPIEMYKGNAEKIAPHMLRIFESSRATGILPNDQRLPTIKAIPKPGKPADVCTSYRPISLINAEPKILAKLLALR